MRRMITENSVLQVPSEKNLVFQGNFKSPSNTIDIPTGTLKNGTYFIRFKESDDEFEWNSIFTIFPNSYGSITLNTCANTFIGGSQTPILCELQAYNDGDGVIFINYDDISYYDFISVEIYKIG